MTLTGFIIFLVIGAVAGWIAGQIMRGGGFGLAGNIVVGVLGALIGGWFFGVLGIDRIDRRRSRRRDHPLSPSAANQTRVTVGPFGSWSPKIFPCEVGLAPHQCWDPRPRLRSRTPAGAHTNSPQKSLEQCPRRSTSKRKTRSRRTRRTSPRTQKR